MIVGDRAAASHRCCRLAAALDGDVLAAPAERRDAIVFAPAVLMAMASDGGEVKEAKEFAWWWFSINKRDDVSMQCPLKLDLLGFEAAHSLFLSLCEQAQNRQTRPERICYE